MNLHRFVAVLASLAGLGLFLYVALTFVIQTRPDYGGTYTEGLVGSPMAANPLFAPFSDPDNDLAALVYAGLTRLGPEGLVLPDLAERWEIDEQGRRYRFYLRQGLRWHDGSPLTATDVVHTIKLIQTPNFAGSADLAALWKTVSVAQIDPLTVQMTLTSPFAPFLRTPRWESCPRTSAALADLPRPASP
jgi:peptide/nickel transport system substrate-binding protein